MKSVAATVLATLILVILLVVWRFFADKWNQVEIVQKYHLTLWVRLAIIGAIVAFVAWQFIPYQSVLQ